MEIKITIKEHEEVACELPFEAKIEETEFDEKYKPIPNYSSENEFFEDEELAKGWILEKLAERFRIAFTKTKKIP